jgi:hypothetical protein
MEELPETGDRPVRSKPEPKKRGAAKVADPKALVKVTTKIPAGDIQKVKVIAAQQGMSLEDAFQEAVSLFIAQY